MHYNSINRLKSGDGKAFYNLLRTEAAASPALMQTIDFVKRRSVHFASHNIQSSVLHLLSRQVHLAALTPNKSLSGNSTPERTRSPLKFHGKPKPWWEYVAAFDIFNLIYFPLLQAQPTAVASRIDKSVSHHSLL